MVFSNMLFLFIFLPITLFLYYLCKIEYRNYVLLGASLIFYAYGEPKLVFLMIFSILLNYFIAVTMEKSHRKKTLLIFGIILNLSFLFVYKYLGFSLYIFDLVFKQNIKVPEIILPIGISFYTFQSLSYIIDVYRGNAKVQHNIVNLGLYVSLFPQLIAGPIVRYNAIAEQITRRRLSITKFSEGSKRFICGFCKKVLLANNLSMVAEYYFGNPSLQTNSVIGAWLGAICYSLQIYYDFSGYSDMAIGLGEMFGFDFEENFNYPYISKTITDFWRRWHISLGSWFRDYVYIPLGGSRVPVFRHIVNLGIVWILTGLWHGAGFSFLTWGLMYFFALVMEKYVIKPEKRKNVVFLSLYRIAILIYIIFCWVIFNSQGLYDGIVYCLSMVGIYYKNELFDMHIVSIICEYGIFIVAGIIYAMPIAPIISKKMNYKCCFIKKWIFPLIYIGGFLWAISFLILGAHNPFVYFNF